MWYILNIDAGTFCKPEMLSFEGDFLEKDSNRKFFFSVPIFIVLKCSFYDLSNVAK